MAIGYYDHPVMIGVPGEDLPHVHHYYGEPHPHYRQRVVIVGGGNSAAESALEMYPRRRARHDRAPRADAEVDDQVLGAARHREPHQGRVDRRAFRRRRPRNPARVGRDRAVPTESPPPCRPTSPFPADGSEDFDAPARPALAGELEIPADAVYLLTGYRADAELLRHAGVLLNERDAPVHDPETFETNVSGLFVAGGAIAGVDTGTIFIENGRFHGEKIIQVIAGRETRCDDFVKKHRLTFATKH